MSKTDDDVPTYRYADLFTENLASARKILPLLFDIIGKPASAVDLGGGTGAWCKVLRELGVPCVLCIDSPRISPDQLLIRPEEFIGCDLAASLPAPVSCDLALCLEVAEHLPESRAAAVVDFLTSSSGLILFSAAIPGQPHGGHVNEKPPGYWKDRFGQRGFSQLDILRPRIIEDQTISYWYRQNLFLYANAANGERIRETRAPFPSIPEDFELVHFRVLETYRAARKPHGLGKVLAEIWPAFRRSLSGRLQRCGRRTPPNL
jgi:hypothetical protein